MHIFVDESGTFAGAANKNSVSAVGALVIPDQHIKGFEKLYGRVRRKLPLEKGEVKGRLLNEAQVGEVMDVLRKLGCLLEIVAVDSATHSDEEIITHKTRQEEGLTRNLTEQHSKRLVADAWELRKQLETTPLQL